MSALLIKPKMHTDKPNAPPRALSWQFWFVGVHFWLYQQSRHKMIVQFTDIIKGRNIV